MLQNEVYVIQVVQQYCAQTKICCETCTRHLALSSKTGTKKGEGGKGLDLHYISDLIADSNKIKRNLKMVIKITK